MDTRIDPKNIDKTIAKGALVNVLGNVGRLSLPLYIILITRMYGPDVMGLFLLVYTMIDIAITLTAAGLNDGVLMFAARWQEDESKDDEHLYRILANGFVVSLVISGALILVTYVGGPQLLRAHYPQPGVVDALQFLVWSVPFRVFSIIVIAATKSMMMMKWDAILQGFLSPVSLLVFSAGLYFVMPTVEGLFFAYLLMSILVAVLSGVVFARYFSFSRLASAVIRFRFFGPLFKFAVPQNLNMTFNTFITNLDVIMLGYFAFRPEIIGFYAIGAQIVRNIRQIKLVFSGIYAPIISRLYERREHDGINRTFSMVSRWTSMLAFPVTMLVVLFKSELLLLFHPSFTTDSTFMVLLLVPPLLSCSVGMSGNILVMTGFSFWNLVNSLTVVGLNAAFNYLLIPRFGLNGAALATAASAAAVSVMALVEVYFLTGTHLIVERIYKPYIAATPAVLLLVLFSQYVHAPLLWQKVLFGVLLMAIFLVVSYWLGIEEEDKRAFMPWKYKQRPTEMAE